jgi:hypothetical protein
VAAGSSPDRHGSFSLGGHVEYVAAFIGELPFFVEVNPRTPRGCQLRCDGIPE